MKTEEKEKILNKLKHMLEIVARDPESNEAKVAGELAALEEATEYLREQYLMD